MELPWTRHGDPEGWMHTIFTSAGGNITRTTGLPPSACVSSWLADSGLGEGEVLEVAAVVRTRIGWWLSGSAENWNGGYAPRVVDTRGADRRYLCLAAVAWAGLGAWLIPFASKRREGQNGWAAVIDTPPVREASA